MYVKNDKINQIIDFNFFILLSDFSSCLKIVLHIFFFFLKQIEDIIFDTYVFYGVIYDFKNLT